MGSNLSPQLCLMPFILGLLSGVRVSFWLLPVPCADTYLQIYGVLEHPEDSRPKDCQEGRVQSNPLSKTTRLRERGILAPVSLLQCE
ncbi:complement factor B [Homo sapiens]|uniref:Complement factor B n=1 Tax=Homo sapiens TaxID=9606 RepID=F8WBL9_HUMAN|nr:complement factor B [Homo sapiens]KAI4017694.1 complement factor B [Homo sapiens]